MFLLWGGYARKKATLITNPAHMVLEAGHPSPLNRAGFLGSRPFSAANKALADGGRPVIDWDPRTVLGSGRARTCSGHRDSRVDGRARGGHRRRTGGVAERRTVDPRAHGERLAPEIAAVLAEAGVRPARARRDRRRERARAVHRAAGRAGHRREHGAGAGDPDVRGVLAGRSGPGGRTGAGAGRDRRTPARDLLRDLCRRVRPGHRAAEVAPQPADVVVPSW